MAGFSRQEQLFLTALVAYQRRDIAQDFADNLPKRMRKPLHITLLCMRLAWIFCRTREDEAIPEVRVTLEDSTVNLTLAADWMEIHPLTIADLEHEMDDLETIGLQLNIHYTHHELN